MNDVAREIFGNIPVEQQRWFYGLAFASLGIFAAGLLRRVQRWRRGRNTSESRWGDVPGRLRHMLRHVFLQPRLRREPSSRRLHPLIFWGFLGLLAATTLVALEHETPLSFLHGTRYLIFSLLSDLAGIALLVGIALAIHRRYVRRLERARASGYGLPLLLLAKLALTGFLLEGLRMAALGHHQLDWSPGGAVVAFALRAAPVEPSVLATWHRSLWWLHAGLALAFVALIPFGRMLHAVAAPLALLFGTARARGALSTPFLLSDVENGTLNRVPPRTAADLSGARLLSLDACTECGLCQQACPAWEAGRPLSPKQVVVELRDHASGHGTGRWPAPLEEVVSPAAAWSCTTCGACVETCPVGIRQIDFLVDVRRALVLEGRLDPSMATALTNLRRTGSPHGLPPEQRLAWASALPAGVGVERSRPGGDVELLLWVGCAGAFDERAQEVTRAVARILSRAGIRYAVLGPEERCTGDPARRLGEEGLFQDLARENVRTLEAHGVRRIVTTCPHCLNTLRNEYPAFGGHYEVLHHSELIARLLADGRLAVRGGANGQTATYHDSCYLGRHNGVYDAPREALGAVSGLELREMERRRERGLCCGAGGSSSWFELEQGERIQGIRYREAQGTGAGVVATACPFCTAMFEEVAAGSAPGDRLRVRDLAEIVEAATRG